MNPTVDFAGKTDNTLIPSWFMRSVGFSGEINRHTYLPSVVYADQGGNQRYEDQPK